MNYLASPRVLVGLVALVIAGFLLYFVMFKRKHDAVMHTAQQIYAVLDSYRITYDIDKRSVDEKADTTPLPFKGVDACIENLAYFVRKNRPVTMIMVGFPFKSANTQKKVIGRLPDMAERKSLEYIHSMMDKIKNIYSPGVSLLVFCDGIFFAEYFGISQTDVQAYEQTLKVLGTDFPAISFITTQDMLKAQKFSSTDELLKFIDNYEPSDEQFKAEYPKIPETALKRFALDFDYPKGREFLKKHSFQEIATALLAREMRLRTYIAKAFPSPEFFRLTVHFSPDVSKKFGIKLSPTSDVTPYHGVLVEETDGSWSIKFKKDVNQKKYALHKEIIHDVECPYFKEV